MSKPSIDELLEKTDSRYMLVSIISKRAREIVDGADILVKTTSTKAVNIAVEEFYQGKITYKE
ncbi:MAG: DNA-directed RNA polymerase subunit omega [Eubacteriales bacterium]|nr:DNA-directed RNA polymerase subunit omega [Eubacteriales bacterium]